MTTISDQPVGWAERARDLDARVRQVCAGLAGARPAERLSAVGALREAFAEIHDLALREAVLDARAQGRALRRIGQDVGCSHEQIRRILQRATAPAVAAPAPTASGDLAAG